MGRVATSASPFIVSATESAERPTPSLAARRAMNSRWRLVTGARIALGDSLAASSATGGTHTSPRYGASPAFSSSHTLPAPQPASCLSPSSVALSVSHTASTGPPRRAASPMTSAMTFLGMPLRSSSTTHQNAPAIIIVSLLNSLGVLAQGADELFHGVFGFARDHPARRPRGQRLELGDTELRRHGRQAEVGGLHVLDLLLLGAHDPLEGRVARLVHALLRRQHGR